MLSSFRVEKYRGFARGAEVELRPLTLFFGFNSSGKSSLVRFLPMLAEALEDRRSPLPLAGEVLRGARYPEVACRSSGGREVGWVLRGDDDAALRVVLRGDTRGHAVDLLELSRSGEGLRADDNPAAGALDAWAPRGWPEVEPLLRAVRDTQWLRGLRALPERWQTIPVGLAERMRSTGEDASDWLVAEGMESGVVAPDSLGGDVDRFFGALGLRLGIVERDDRYGVTVARRAVGSSATPLADGGEGYVQVLPVLVAVSRAARGGPPIVCLEQPELHLHTRAQAALGQWFAEQVRPGGPARLLVETHSEVLLAAIQLAVAKGELPRERVLVYWVWQDEQGVSTAERVELTDLGRPDGPLPVDLFGDATRLAKELFRVRMAKEA